MQMFDESVGMTGDLCSLCPSQLLIHTNTLVTLLNSVFWIDKMLCRHGGAG